MMVLVTYDISTETSAGQKRLRRVAKVCQDYGQRVQESVFECLLEPAQLIQLKHRLTEMIDIEKDSLRFYELGDRWSGRVDHVGTKASIDLTGPLLV